MSNQYFRFKQFTVFQDKSAMKVCTDACLFGAWIAAEVMPFTSGHPVMDAGTGTGLLSLMLAQKSGAHITAVEIDAGAYEQAIENIAGSPWKDRIDVIHDDVLQVHGGGKYGLIISNPPFYERDLRSPVVAVNAARHDAFLRLGELLSWAQDALLPKGVLALLLPYHRTAYCIRLAETLGFYCVASVFVKQTPEHAFFRSILCFSKEPALLRQEMIVIKERGIYTPRFVALLRDYYLFL